MKKLKLQSVYDIYSLYQVVNGYSRGDAYQSYYNIFSLYAQQSDRTHITMLDIGAGTGHFKDIAIQAARQAGLIIDYTSQDQTAGADICCDIFDLANYMDKEGIAPYDLSILVHNVMNCALPHHSLDAFYANLKRSGNVIINQCATPYYWSAVADDENARTYDVLVLPNNPVLKDLDLEPDTYIFQLTDSVFATDVEGLYEDHQDILITKNGVPVMQIEISGRNDIQVFDNVPGIKYTSNSLTKGLPVLAELVEPYNNLVNTDDLSFDYYVYSVN